MGGIIPGLLTGAGAGVGAIFGSPQLGAGIGGILGSIFGAENVDTTPYKNRAYYLQELAKKFYDPNSRFYTDATRRQKNTLLDMYLAGVRAQKNQLAAKGINSTGISSQLTKEAGARASEGSSKFANDLYRQGIGYAGQLEGETDSMLKLLAGLESGNVGIGNSLANQFGNIGAGLLGNYFTDRRTAEYYKTLKSLYEDNGATKATPTKPKGAAALPYNFSSFRDYLSTGMIPTFRFP